MESAVFDMKNLLCSSTNMLKSMLQYSDKPFGECNRIAQQEFTESDQFAKDTVYSWIRQVGGKVLNTDEAYYSHDFIAELNGKIVKVEVERKKSGWAEDEFKWSTHDVPYRKSTSCANLFFQINQRGTAMMMCPMSVVKSSPIKRKNTYLTKNEPFYAVPTSNVRYYFLEDGVWYEDEITSDASSS